jgi:hypothetical protein
VFADQLRSAIERVPRSQLVELSSALWKAHYAEQISELEAQQLSELIEARKIVPAVAPPQRQVGSRPRTPASLLRRRGFATSGALPSNIACNFTMAELAVLSVVAFEVREQGSCEMPIGKIAALAGVSETMVRNALRRARQMCLLTIEERRVSHWRNLPNVIRIIAPEWLAWLRLRSPRGGGCRFVQPTNTDSNKNAPLRGFERGSAAGRRVNAPFTRGRAP